MLKQWQRKAKGKFPLVTALLIVLAVSGGIFAYTYTTTVGTIGIASPTGDVATVNESASQPDWSSITDNLSENTTCGEVPTGDLFEIIPNAAYTGDLTADISLTNTASLIKAYQYLNMKVYVAGSESANQTPNYQLLTLQNGQAIFSLTGLTATQNTWTQTSKADFDGGTLNQVDTATSPGDVLLDTFGDNVTDAFNDATKIASSVNVTVTGGQVKLTSSAGASANETLRPNAAGDETLIAEQFPNTGAHWDKVDEATSDGDSTYVATSSTNYEEDLYNLPAHAAPSGATINYVRVYMVARAADTPQQPSAYLHIKTNGVEYNGTEQLLTNSYATYSYQWNTNPQTGQVWTWTEIDNLQAGIGIRRAKTSGPGSDRYTLVTQVYVEVNYTETTYDSPGTVTSVNLLSAESVASVDSFYYNAPSIPSGTGLRVQYSTDNSNWYNSAGTLNGWDTLSQGTDNISLSGLGWSGSNFYYHMEFTSDGSNTPVLEEIRVYFSTYYSSGELTSSPFDAGSDAAWDWLNIYFTLTEPAGTDIKFQLRSASTEAGLGSATWYGPTGTGDYYTASGTAINSVHDGDRWIQYKAYFSGPGDSTPTLSEVSITYTAPAVSYTIEITGGAYCLISDNTSEWGSGWTTTPDFFAEAKQR